MWFRHTGKGNGQMGYSQLRVRVFFKRGLESALLIVDACVCHVQLLAARVHNMHVHRPHSKHPCQRRRHRVFIQLLTTQGTRILDIQVSKSRPKALHSINQNVRPASLQQLHEEEPPGLRSLSPALPPSAMFSRRLSADGSTAAALADTGCSGLRWWSFILALLCRSPPLPFTAGGV